MSHATPTQAAHPTDTRQQIAAIRKRLERWELTHLRALCAELHERLERCEMERDAARSEAMQAWDAADMWAGQATDLATDIQALGRDVGMAPSGHLMTMPASEGVNIDAVHRVHTPVLTPVLDAAEAKYNGLHGAMA